MYRRKEKIKRSQGALLRTLLFGLRPPLLPLSVFAVAIEMDPAEMRGLSMALRLLHSLNDRVNYWAIFWWPTNIFPPCALLFRRREACWEQTGAEEERTGVLQWWEMSVLRPVTVHLLPLAWTTLDRFGKCLKWPWFVRRGIEFGRSAAGMRPGARRRIVSVRGEGGCITPICQDDS